MHIRALLAAAALALAGFPALAQPINSSTQYAEDTAAPNAFRGTAGLVVRKDTAASLAGTDGDFTALIVDATNRLWTNDALLNTAFGTTAATAYTGTGTTAMGYLRAIADSAISATPAVINQTQINGVTLLAGNGATGTGSPRVTLANNGPTFGDIAATAPTIAQLSGVQSGANMVSMIQASASVAISVSTATTTQLVALSGSTKIYVTAWDVIAAGTGNIKLVYGTGASCGTGTTDLTGNYNLVAQAGIAKGGGLGPIIVVPAGNALCVTTSAAVGMAGSVAYTQF